MKEFIDIEKYGKLYIDRILFEANFPIIFTCKNDRGEIFICVCCQNNDKGRKWLVGKTDSISIIRMLKDEITIRETICAHSSGKISVDYIDGEYRVEYNNSDWDEGSIYLPKEDSYMFAEEGEFDDDIAYFSSIIEIRYEANYYKNVFERLEITNEEFEPVIDRYNEFISLIGNVVVSSKVVNTLDVVGELSQNKEKYLNRGEYKLILENKFNTSLNDNISIKVGTADNCLINAA